MFYEKASPEDWDTLQVHRSDSSASTRLFVAALNKSTTEESLFRYFCRFGEVSHTEIARSRNNKSKSYGYVVFQHFFGKINAIQASYHSLDGSELRVEEALDPELRKSKHDDLAARRIHIKSSQGDLPSTVTHNELYDSLLRYGTPLWITSLRRSNPYSNPNSFYCYVTMDRPQAVERILQQGSLILKSGVRISARKCKIRHLKLDHSMIERYQTSSIEEIPNLSANCPKQSFECQLNPNIDLASECPHQQLQSKYQRSFQVNQVVLSTTKSTNLGCRSLAINSAATADRHQANPGLGSVFKTSCLKFGSERRPANRSRFNDPNLRFNVSRVVGLGAIPFPVCSIRILQ